MVETGPEKLVDMPEALETGILGTAGQVLCIADRSQWDQMSSLLLLLAFLTEYGLYQ
jgi:hypothetical protein